MKLSLIVPAYNEEKRLGNTLDALKKYLRTFDWQSEIIVVNDGSTDDTAALVRSKHVKLLSYKKNMGKGYAIKKGVEAAKGEFILFLDADNATPIEEFAKLFDKMKSADIAIGSRYLPESRVEKKQSVLRIIIGRLGNLVIQMLILKNIKDTQCGFKLFKSKIAKELFSQLQTFKFGFDIEILARADRKKYKIAEVPVTWLHNPVSRVRPIKDAARTFMDLLQLCRLVD